MSRLTQTPRSPQFDYREVQNDQKFGWVQNVQRNTTCRTRRTNRTLRHLESYANGITQHQTVENGWCHDHFDPTHRKWQDDEEDQKSFEIKHCQFTNTFPFHLLTNKLYKQNHVVFILNYTTVSSLSHRKLTLIIEICMVEILTVEWLTRKLHFIWGHG